MVHHEHEWLPSQDPSDIIYEDGALHLYEYCNFVEITGSATSERLDETFYEEGYNCDAHRHHRFDLVGIERLHGLADAHEDYAETLCEGREAILEAYERDPRLVEEIEQRAAERLCGDDGDDPLAFDLYGFERIEQRDFSFTVEVPHSHGRTFEYRLTYEHDETMVDEL